MFIVQHHAISRPQQVALASGKLMLVAVTKPAD